VAACHTGQLILKDKRYVIEGGPAVTDLSQLTNALREALAQTALSAKLPFFDGRFGRFAKRALGTEYSDLTRVNYPRNSMEYLVLWSISQLGSTSRKGLPASMRSIARQSGARTRDQALRQLRQHQRPRQLPAHLDIAIVRLGAVRRLNHAAIGTQCRRGDGGSAELNLTAPLKQGRVASSIPFDNLHWIEQQLAGKDQPLVAKAFTGLNAPAWPDSFPAIDKAKAAVGAQLYEKHCSGCHLPALTLDIVHGKAPDAEFWKNFGPIRWRGRAGQEKQTKESGLNVKIAQAKPYRHRPGPGRRAAQSHRGHRRQRTGQGGPEQPGLGLDIDVCQWKAENTLDTIHLSDHVMQLYALALGAVVQSGIDEWLRSTGTVHAEIEGDRPNCLAAGFGYKARPLNGVWATAPFLHNGSVPTIYDLLSPVAERPKVCLLGEPSFPGGYRDAAGRS